MTFESEVLNGYKAGETSLRELAAKLNTNHHKIKRVLLKNGIIPQKAKRRPFSPEHRRAISAATKGRKTWSKGKKMDRITILKNMRSHLRFSISLCWLDGFEDVDKLKMLNSMLTPRSGRWNISTEKYMRIVEYFYYDRQFNLVYNRWLSNKTFYLKPTFDHLVPVSKGGSYELKNLQVLSWFENRCKNDMTQSEWGNLKRDIATYFV